MYYIEYTAGKRNWHLVAPNGNVIITSGRYATKWNAKRSAKKWAAQTGCELRLV